MEDIRIVINRSSRLIKSISKRILGNDGENLQENLVFSFEDEFVNGQARLEYQLPNDTTGWLTLTEGEETYQIPVRNVLMSEGTIFFQLVVTEGTDETSIPLFKSNIFKMKINESLNTVEIEAPDGYATWLDLANTKLNQMDNFDINVSKVGDTATIEVTNRLGETTSANIDDGVGLQHDWNGTSLGIKREDEQAYEYVDLKGDKGDQGDKPVKGVDYFTAQDIADMEDYVINSSTSAFNQNAAQKTSDFNNNASSKTTAFNNNATSKIGDFDTNASNKTTAFNNNASSKTDAFNGNATDKTSTFNNNASEKQGAYDSNATSKTTSFNDNATAKTTAFDENAQDKIDEYDEHVEELNDEIEYLQDQVADLSDNQLIAEEEGTEIYVTDSARARLNDFRFTKESSQVTTTGKNLYGGFIFNKVNSGITFNYNEDGTIDANGTATNTARSMLSSEASQYLKRLNAGTYIISGGTGDANIEVCNLNSTIATDTGNGAQFTLNEESDIFIRLKVASGKVLNNVKIYSMLSVSGGDYEPYTGGEASPSSDYPQDVEVVEGYENLFDKDNANIINCLINGTTKAIGNYNDAKTLYIPINGGLTYTIYKRVSQRFVVGSCSSIPSNNVTCSVAIQDNSSNKITITTNENDNYLAVFYYLNGVDTLTEQEILNSIMITKGTSEHPYVPYGNNYVDVKIHGGNNYLDLSKFSKGRLDNGVIGYESGVSSLITTNDSITFTTNTDYRGVSSDFMKLKTSYYFILTYNSATITPTIIAHFYDANKNYLSNVAGYKVPNQNAIRWLNNVDNAKYVRLNIMLNSASTQTITYPQLQFVEDLEIPTYEPYQESIVPIALNGNFIGGISDYKDTLIVDKFGKCYLNKVINKKIIDGSEFIERETTINNHYFFYIRNIMNVDYDNSSYVPKIICNKLMPVSRTDQYKEIQGISSATNSLRIYIDEVKDMTASEVKNWLVTHNLITYYGVMTSDLIDLNYTIDLKTFKGVSNITNSEEANMKIRYVQDINTIISNIQNAILEIGGE